MSDTLDALFRPRSVAVIGASRDPASIGGEVLRNLVHGGFCGPVHPVNHRAAYVGSIQAYPSVVDVPGEIDLAVIAVPKQHALTVMTDCASKGVRGAVVITAGFKEIGGAGAELEAEMADIARAAGIRLVGPNCMGIINTEPTVHLNATFSKTQPRRGPVAFLSQSGALGETVLARAEAIGVGLAMFASIGNKADVSGNDLLEYWGDDDDIEVILLYLENFGNPRNFARIASAVTRVKPVIAVKSGRTAAGARAASSHTGSLAGSDAATEALLAQCGVLRALTVDELFDLGKAFSHSKLPRGRRVAVISNAGGPGILAADACGQWDLDVTPLAEETKGVIRKEVHPDASLDNPIDLIAAATADHYRATLRPVMADDGIDAGIVLCVPPVTIDTTEVARAIADARTDKPIIGCFMGIESTGIELLEGAGVPVFDFPESAVRAMAALARYRELRERPLDEPPVVAADRERARAIVAAAIADRRTQLTLSESLALIGCYGLASVTTRTVASREEALDAALELDYPVVLKSGAPGHKTDRGAVALDLRSADDVIAAWQRIFAAGDDDLRPAVIQPMASGGREVVVGITTDRNLGPLVMFGLGGVYVEVLHDVAFRIAPLGERTAYEMVRSIRGLPLLEGFRGAAPVDIKALERVLVSVAALACDLPEVVELDVNPMMAFPAGTEPVAVDARVRLVSNRGHEPV